MVQLPCPRCGELETLGTFCRDCLRELYPLVKTVKPAKLVLCASCDNVKLHSDWKTMPEDVAVQRAIEPALVFSDAEVVSVEIAHVDLERKPGIKKTAKVFAVVTGKQESGPEYEEEYDIPLTYEVTLCSRCKRKGTSHFEGILQIRNQTPAVRKEIYEYVSAHRAKGLRLAKEVPCGSGSDYYLSDQRSVQPLAQRLRTTFGGELKVGAQHFSHDTTAGKNLYRVNAYLEIPEYTKGDVIKRDESYFYVLGVSTKVKAENLQTGSQESFPYQKGSAKRLPVRTTRISRLSPLEVIHPLTYQSIAPTNSKYAPTELEVDEETSVAYDGDYVFLIPHTQEKDEVKRVRKRHSQKRKRKDDDLITED